MTSLFTRFVAQGIDVPVTDPRLLTHIETSEVVTADEGQAATVLIDLQSAAIQPSASTEDSDSVDGTQSPT